jgi:hypothetical protein
VTSGSAVRAIPARTATPPTAWGRPTGSPKTTTPAMAPTTGSRLRKAPAISGATRACPYANSVNGARVPPTTSPAVARAVPAWAGTAGTPSRIPATGSAATAAAANWTAVTATGSRPTSIRGCATTNPADRTSDARTSESPVNVAAPPPSAAIPATPVSATANPAHETGPTTLRPSPTAISATRIGVPPTSRAAWLTLVRAMPAFCNTMTMP